jgi:hypothetical protein
MLTHFAKPTKNPAFQRDAARQGASSQSAPANFFAHFSLFTKSALKPRLTVTDKFRLNPQRREIRRDTQSHFRLLPFFEASGEERPHAGRLHHYGAMEMATKTAGKTTATKSAKRSPKAAPKRTSAKPAAKQSPKAKVGAKKTAKRSITKK